jgi:hypothetical protein
VFGVSVATQTYIFLNGQETLSNVRETFIRRLNLCLEQNGQIFEHLVG